MSIFHHQSVMFSQPDPLGDGLGDEIAAEQQEAEAITSLDDTSPRELEQFWGQVISDAKKDKDFFAFNDD